MMGCCQNQIFLLLVLVLASVVCCQSDSFFIAWDDLKLVKDYNEKNRAEVSDSKDVSNQTRVIVVDKLGRGDSMTVQGAIDLIPHNNSQRIKISISPGIYRFCFGFNFFGYGQWKLCSG